MPEELWTPPSDETREEAEEIAEVREIFSGDSGTAGETTGEASTDETGGEDLSGLEEHETAFFVIVRKDGNAYVEFDTSKLENMLFERPPDYNTVWRACTEVSRDIEAMNVVQRLMMAMQTQVAMEQARQDEMRVMQKIGARGGLRQK